MASRPKKLLSFFLRAGLAQQEDEEDILADILDAESLDDLARIIAERNVSHRDLCDCIEDFLRE